MSEERFSGLAMSAMRAHQHGIADGPLYGQIWNQNEENLHIQT